jgi:two-component system sensor histidine kinase KdpD
VRAQLGLAGALFCVPATVVLAALAGGSRPVLLATATGFLATDFFFTVPYHSLRIGRLIDVLGLVAFAVVAVSIGFLVDILSRAAARAAAAQAEAENLARLAVAGLLRDRARFLRELRTTLDLDAATVVPRGGEAHGPDTLQAVLPDGDLLVLTPSAGGPRADLARAFVTELRRANP